MARSSRIKVALWMTALLMWVCTPSYARADANTNEALKAIADTAAAICGVVATAGETESTKVTGDVKAQLSGLVKKLADLGISGSGSYDINKYVGVVQTDLPSALNSLRECKLKVFETLQEKMISSENNAPRPAQSQWITASLVIQGCGQSGCYQNREVCEYVPGGTKATGATRGESDTLGLAYGSRAGPAFIRGPQVCQVFTQHSHNTTRTVSFQFEVIPQ